MLGGPLARGLPASPNGRNILTRISQAVGRRRSGALPRTPPGHSPPAYSQKGPLGDPSQRTRPEQFKSGPVQPHGMGSVRSGETEAVAQQQGVNLARTENTAQSPYGWRVMRNGLGREQLPGHGGRGRGTECGVPPGGEVAQCATGYVRAETGAARRGRTEGQIDGPAVTAERVVDERGSEPSPCRGVRRPHGGSDGAFGPARQDVRRARRHVAHLPTREVAGAAPRGRLFSTPQPRAARPRGADGAVGVRSTRLRRGRRPVSAGASASAPDLEVRDGTAVAPGRRRERHRRLRVERFGAYGRRRDETRPRQRAETERRPKRPAGKSSHKSGERNACLEVSRNESPDSPANALNQFLTPWCLIDPERGEGPRRRHSTRSLFPRLPGSPCLPGS